MDYPGMIRQLGIEPFEDSSPSELVCEGLIARRPQRRERIGVKYLGLTILGVFATELLQGPCIGTYARCVIERIGALVEGFHRCNVITFACVFAAYGFGLVDCLFSL